MDSQMAIQRRRGPELVTDRIELRKELTAGGDVYFTITIRQHDYHDPESLYIALAAMTYEQFMAMKQDMEGME